VARGRDRSESSARNPLVPHAESAKTVVAAASRAMLTTATRIATVATAGPERGTATATPEELRVERQPLGGDSEMLTGGPDILRAAAPRFTGHAESGGGTAGVFDRWACPRRAKDRAPARVEAINSGCEVSNPSANPAAEHGYPSTALSSW
jgi:hypothetical protein